MLINRIALHPLLLLVLSAAVAVAAPDAAHQHENHDHAAHPAAAEHDHHDEPGSHEADADKDHHNEHTEHDDHGHHAAADTIELTPQQQEQIGLVVARATAGSLAHAVSLVGEVRINTDHMAHLVPRVPGIVREVHVSLGAHVEEGQPLAVIDSPQLAELKADYLEKVHNLAVKRRAYERQQYLHDEKIASEAAWLQAQAAFQTAEILQRTARRRLLVVGLAAGEITALASLSDDAFGSYTLRSPLTGTIISKHITRGEKISDREVFAVADLRTVWVDLQIPARHLDQVHEGQSVSLTSTEGHTATGTLSLIGPLVDTESRTALGRVVLPNPQGHWKPGLFVTGSILTQSEEETVIVASSAIQNVEGESVVFVPAAHGYRSTPVTLGRQLEHQTEILSGLAPGAPYVARGAFDLKAVQVTTGMDPHAGHGH